MSRNHHHSCVQSLLKTLFPLLPKTSSSPLRASIRKTILSDIRTANLKGQNHKLNRSVQAMLFGMVERGMDAEVVGDKGKARASQGPASQGEEAMWAVVLSKELWKKGIWYVINPFAYLLDLIISRNDGKTVSIVALGCFHPVLKVQSASLHFFLGSDEEEESSDDEEDVCGITKPAVCVVHHTLSFQMRKRFCIDAKSTRKPVAGRRRHGRLSR